MRRDESAVAVAEDDERWCVVCVAAGEVGLEEGGEVTGVLMTCMIACVSMLCTSMALLGSKERMYG
jgi:hypothetical protein